MKALHAKAYIAFLYVNANMRCCLPFWKFI